ncbi:MAG: MlaD family protein [Bacteroidetes bacterium]|nr:MlaD family protein [Bacteroidota bacterium]
MFTLKKIKISREVKIGIIFVITIALFVWGINFLKGTDIFSHHRIFYAVYDRVDGLVAANPVNINGMKVGQVKSLRFADKTTAKIIVELSLNTDLPVPDNSVARIYSEDLLGAKAVAIVLGNSSTFCTNGDTLANEIEESLKDEVNRQVLPIKRKAENLLLSIDSMVTIIQYVFNAEMRTNLIGSVASIKKTIDHLQSTSQLIDTLMQSQHSRFEAIIANINSITSNLKNNNNNITNILQNFSSISDTLAKAKVSETLANTNRTIHDLSLVLEKIEKGQGSIGLLISDDSLYKHLNASARELNLLIEDLRVNPGRYIHFSVFGKKNKEEKK